MNATEANDKTRPNTSGAFNGLSREAIEALPAATYVTNAEGRLTLYNEAAAELWGCRPQLGESKFCGSWKLYWPDGTPLPHNQCPMAMALHQRRPIRGMEVVAERPDGTRVPFIPYPMPLFDASGRLTGAVNMLVDISERKRTEAILEARNAQFELASRIGQIGTYSYNYRTRILRLSPGCAAIYGLPRETREITQKDWRAQVHPDDLPRIDAVSRQALTHRQSELVLEFRIIRPDGKTRWIESRILVTYNDVGRAVQMIGANIDVTARKQTELDLAERNVQLALAEKVSRVGSFVNDTQTDTIQFSAGFAAIHGFPEGTSKILRSQWRAIADPEDVERMDEVRQQVFRQKQSEYSVDYRINPPGVGVRWIESRAFVSYDGDGHPRVVGVNIDVTERKRVENALRRSEAELVEAQRLAHVGSWSWDATTNTFLASHELSRICDWDPTRHLLDERRDHLVDDWEQLSAAARKAMQTGVAYEFDVQSLRNGTPIWVTARGEAVYDSKGQIVGLRGTVQDITERRMTELTLAERNVQLALAEEAALVGSWAYDPDTEIMQVSEGYAAIHGFPEGTTEIARSECLAGVHPDDIGRVEQSRSEAFQASRREYSVEYRIFRPGGEVRWVETRCFISYNSEGCPHRVVGLSIDITERKRAVDRLQESERKLRDLLGALPAAVYVTDAAGHITYCNQSAVDLWGSEPKLGRDKWSELVKYHHADGSSMALADCPTEVALRQGRIVRGQEAIIERKDGTRIPIIPYPTPLRDETGTIVAVVNMTIDISERKKAELILADQTTQLALAGKAALVGSFAYDLETERMEISEGYAAIHGFPNGTTEIARSEWQRGLLPEDRVRLEEIRSRCFRARLDEYGADYRIVRSKGAVRWIEARCFVSYHGDGRPKRVVGVNIDVSERKRAEEHHRAMNAELDHRGKNVLATVIAIITQTQKASSSLADFVAGLDNRMKSMAGAHELLSQGNWRGVTLADIVRRELAPYAAGNAEIGGPSVTLRAEATQAVAMVLHELTTNAAKHGAFSNQSGQVLLRWWWLQNGSHGPLAIEWQEIGGPPVPAPSHSGYGTSIIRELIPYELGGKVDLAFAADGLRCRLHIPADWISGGSRLNDDLYEMDSAGTSPH